MRHFWCDASRACLLAGRAVRLRLDYWRLPRQPASTKPLTHTRQNPHHHTTTARPHHNTILSHASPAIAQGSIISYQHPPNVRLPSLSPHRPHRCKPCPPRGGFLSPGRRRRHVAEWSLACLAMRWTSRASEDSTSTEERCGAPYCWYCCCYRSSRLHDAYSPSMSTCECPRRRASCWSL